MSVYYGHCNYLFEFISYSNILHSWPQRVNIQRDMVGGLFLLAIPGILLANTYVGFAHLGGVIYCCGDKSLQYKAIMMAVLLNLL
jgi:hypothetical protein